MKHTQPTREKLMKNLKMLSVLLAIITISACSDGYEELDFPAMPKELEGCKVYILTNTSGDVVTVIRYYA